MSDQLNLFADAPAGPKGLRYQPEFVSRDQERILIDRLRDLPLTPFQFGAFEGKRRVASFGWRYDYSRQALETADDIPKWLSPLAAQIAQFAELPTGAVQQVLCTEYEARVGIGWHRDKPHFDRIFGLSLASACKFRFRRKTGVAWRRFTLEAEPRSLYMMSDESRHIWEHSIPPVETTRYSITFRTMAEDRRKAGRVQAYVEGDTLRKSR
ncbi:alpha-ketoglutarate-dependent dioxygenase AlkB [Pseudorhodoplanes sp.]|uniref:alpha-ketoglutarate-dependent dioxygenase AlkB n=1 Tax=Pseudorhodoplanes sp. TaxID=1934341 RepID=UPI002C165948|nr:alpha-ketoglutarate-dependent dioxygenase AlkB [Pseudorhodoplanes sp.]HWV55456.1 alpha-ketoglutarate-dependent dioxygenase AlkB [Pseudorhodoplanes sp.]